MIWCWEQKLNLLHVSPWYIFTRMPEYIPLIVKITLSCHVCPTFYASCNKWFVIPVLKGHCSKNNGCNHILVWIHFTQGTSCCHDISSLSILYECIWVNRGIYKEQQVLLGPEITYPFPNFNDTTVEVKELISNLIPHFTGHVITYPCWDQILSMLKKKICTRAEQPVQNYKSCECGKIYREAVIYMNASDQSIA